MRLGAFASGFITKKDTYTSIKEKARTANGGFLWSTISGFRARASSITNGQSLVADRRQVPDDHSPA